VSQKLPAVTPKQLIRVLERKGWQVDRIRGSHHILTHREQQRVLVVPMHNRDLKIGTVTTILRNAGISRDELRELL
jgi:predicted RNA binding protein YcfA (HicA-like mRNA interferase family)